MAPRPRSSCSTSGSPAADDGRDDQRVRPLTGSLPFISPEQILGLAPGVQNDIFAYGVVLFQMLTGALPYPSARGTSGSSIADRLTAKAHAPSRPVAALPEWLDELVGRCPAEREGRFPDVEAVLAALDATVARER